MEKFGIFELLDALSALAAPNERKQAPDAEQKSDPPERDAPPAAPNANRDALDAFLRRHDDILRRTEGR